MLTIALMTNLLLPMAPVAISKADPCTKLKVTTSDVALKLEPNAQARVLGYARPGEILTVQNNDGTIHRWDGWWLVLRQDGSRYWVQRKQLSCLSTEKIPAQGLVAYYPFNGNTKDESGNGKNGLPGTVRNGVFNEDRFGVSRSAYRFHGDSVVYNNNLKLKNNFTVSFWVNTSKIQPEFGEKITGVEGTGEPNYVIYPVHGELVGGGDNVGVGLSVGANGVSVYEHSTYYMPAVLVYSTKLQGWNHIALTYQNHQAKLYINGFFVKTGLNSGKTPNISLLSDEYESGIGGGRWGHFTGLVDEIHFYNRALSDLEIKAFCPKSE